MTDEIDEELQRMANEEGLTAEEIIAGMVATAESGESSGHFRFASGDEARRLTEMLWEGPVPQNVLVFFTDPDPHLYVAGDVLTTDPRYPGQLLCDACGFLEVARWHRPEHQKEE